MKRALIATVFNSDSILFLSHKLGINHIILLVDKDTQERTYYKTDVKEIIESSVNEIKKQFKKEETERETGKVIETTLSEIKTEKIPLWDVLEISKICTKKIDELFSNGFEIYLDITQGQKTQSLGLLFAGFIKASKIKGVYYYNHYEKNEVELPILSFELTKSQQQLLTLLNNFDVNTETLSELATETKKSRPLLYKNLKELQRKRLIDKSFQLTLGGQLAKI
jgi:CRISPR locus-related DNA-binding protein